MLIEGSIQHLSGSYRKKFKDRWVQVIEMYKSQDGADMELCPDEVVMNVMKQVKGTKELK